MTVDLNPDFGVTISQARGRKGYLAIGEIFARATMKNIGIRVQGEGRTWSAAASRALAEARLKCPSELPNVD
jgi:hypothetical protein